jgi:hypothetical protein
MFEDVEKIENPQTGSWASLTTIQQAGTMCACALFVVSLVTSFWSCGAAVILGVCAASSLLLGLVAGALWRARHALHFWYSMAFACIVHACFLPIYAWMMADMLATDNPRGTGKALLLLSLLLIVVEATLLIGVLKRIALWFFKRRLKSNPYNRGAFPGK